MAHDGPPVPSCGARSDRVDLLGLRALGAAAGGELDPLVFLEPAVTTSPEGGVVNEDIGSIVVGAAYAGPGLLRPPVSESQALESTAPRQNFAGAVTRTRTSTTTRTSKHHRAIQALPGPRAAAHQAAGPGADHAGVMRSQQTRPRTRLSLRIVNLKEVLGRAEGSKGP